MDSERSYLKLSLLYIERRFNIYYIKIYSIIWRHPQIFEGIFNSFEDIFK